MKITKANEIDRAFRRFAAGDDSAFLTLFEYYNPRFGIYCSKRYGLTHAEAEDALQSVWERTLRLRAKRKAEEIENFGAFFYRMLTNASLDIIRRRRNAVAIDTEALEVASEHEASTPFSQMNGYVMEAFASLSEDHREVLLLHLYAGYELAEIAELLQKSRDAIWARASRARIELRKRVRELSEREQIPLSEFKVLAR